MRYIKGFLTIDNFKLAFTRIVQGSNLAYKQYYRYLFSAYQLASDDILFDIIGGIKKGIYEPSLPITIYLPKRSGILRPIKVLCMRDLIVYQALINIVALKYASQQKKYALKRTFGAIFAGKRSPFFYRSWKKCYQMYNNKIEKLFNRGHKFVADFDLVSFYELIDHKLLRTFLERRIKDPAFLDLLFRCLEKWTENNKGLCVNHGIPQGPEPSAFLAEIFLLPFDKGRFYRTHYIRYIDDIKLMAKSKVYLKKALLKLDMYSKSLGLVPQAQKIVVKEIKSLSELQKTVPSTIASSSTYNIVGNVTERRMYRVFRNSLTKKSKRWLVNDLTKFKFTIRRLKPRRNVLKLLAHIVPDYPHCSWVLCDYLKKFKNNQYAADIIANILRTDPIYDSVAADYIDALDVCEPSSNIGPYRNIIRTALKRSCEKSILLTLALSKFKCRRLSVHRAIEEINKQSEPVVKGLLIDYLFGDNATASCDILTSKTLLEKELSSANDDLALYCAGLYFANWPSRISGKLNRHVLLLMKSIGLRKRGPKRRSILAVFFKEKFKIYIVINWYRALRRDLRNAESKCLTLQKHLIGDPTSRIMALDTFNETLIQSFSQNHPQLTTSYRRAAGNKPNPDYGAWLRQPDLRRVIPNYHQWFKDVHDTRVKADMAHAKQRSGEPTKPISYTQAGKILKKAQRSWAELLLEWQRII